jgi:hypothetical protein
MPRVIVRDTAAEFPLESEALGARLFEGDLAIDLATDAGYYWNGSAWVPLASAPAPDPTTYRRWAFMFGGR